MRWQEARTPENPRRFRFHRCLGRGGFGEVYRATMWREGGVSTEVAVKVLSGDLSPDSDAVCRLKDEGRLLGALSHPGIVKVFDLVVLGGRVSLVTEYIEGQDLHHVFYGHRPHNSLPGQPVAAQPEPFPIRALVETIGHVAEALHAAYTSPSPTGEGPMGLVHRDVKPQNIRMSVHGTVKLLDFGIARTRNLDREAKTQENLLMGSWPYLPPERLGDDDDLGPECDVYALGCTLYEGLAGERLMEGKRLLDLYQMLEEDGGYEAVVEPAIDRLRGKIPKGLVHLLGLMLSTDPSDRPVPEDVTDRCEDLSETIPGWNLRRWARDRKWPDTLETDGPLTDQDLTEGTLDVPKPTRKGSEPPAPVRSIVPVMVQQTPTEDIDLPNDTDDEHHVSVTLGTGTHNKKSDVHRLKGRPVTPPPPPPFHGTTARILPQAAPPGPPKLSKANVVVKESPESTEDEPTVTREDRPRWDEEEEPTQNHNDTDALSAGNSSFGVVLDEDRAEPQVGPFHESTRTPSTRTPSFHTPATSRSPEGGSSFRGLPVDRTLGISAPSQGDRREPQLPELLALDIDEEPRAPGSNRAQAGLFGAVGVGMVLLGLLLFVLLGAGTIAGGLYWYSSVALQQPQPVPVPLPIPSILPTPPPVPVSAPTVPEPVKPEPVKPEPAQPAPVKPEPVKPEPAQPSPTGKPPAHVIIVEPDPVPVPASVPAPDPAPVPASVPVPAPAEPEPQPSSAGPAALVVEGDAIVELQGDFGGFRSGTPLPPGGYAVWADFGEGLVDTGARTIALPGGSVYANCSKATKKCKVTP